MTYALAVLLGAAAVWLAQWVVRRHVPIKTERYERIIASPDHNEFYYRIRFYMPEGWEPEAQVYVEDMRYNNVTPTWLALPKATAP